MEFLSLIILPVFLLVSMYFMIVRPNKKQRDALSSFQSKLKNGDKVITTAGIYGVIEAMDEETITLTMVDGNLIKFRKDAIVRMQRTEDMTEEIAEGEKEDENK